MGMYTKINAVIPIKSNAPQEILNDLHAMFNTNNERKEPSDKIKNLMKRWWFPHSDGSYYFSATANSAIKYEDHNTYACVLHIDTDFKNYDNEIDKFFEWISPYADMDENEFVGYSRYEECITPTLYFYRNGTITEQTIKTYKDNSLYLSW